MLNTKFVKIDIPLFFVIVIENSKRQTDTILRQHRSQQRDERTSSKLI